MRRPRHLLLALTLSLPTLVGWGQERILPVNLKGPGANYEANLPEGFNRLALGDPAPDFNLIGVDDRFYRLADFAGAKVLMVVFLSNHCPFSHAQETRLIPLVRELAPQGLKVVAIQPNTPLPDYASGLAYSKYNDSFEEMKLYAAENSFPFPYLYDGDTQEVAKAYGALATPHVYLFDSDLRLRYAGRFDDGRFPEADSVTHHDTRDALEAMLAGRPVAVPFTKPMGCAVKWNDPEEERTADYQPEWKHEPITLETIDAAATAELVRNLSKKVRLFNVWSTVSAPSRTKMIEFAKLARRLDRRDFEVITISVDAAADEAKALAFLQEQHVGMPARIKASLQSEGRSTNNYRFTDGSVAELASALDPAWPGAPLPHSVLVAPGGQVLWRYTGAGFDPVQLSRVILDQLGGFYPRE